MQKILSISLHLVYSSYSFLFLLTSASDTLLCAVISIYGAFLMFIYGFLYLVQLFLSYPVFSSTFHQKIFHENYEFYQLISKLKFKFTSLCVFFVKKYFVVAKSYSSWWNFDEMNGPIFAILLLIYEKRNSSLSFIWLLNIKFEAIHFFKVHKATKWINQAK